MLDLTRPLCKSVIIDSKEYAINFDFRTGIRLCALLEDDSIDEQLKPLLALRLYYPDIPNDIICALEKIIWFYNCGEESSGNGSSGNIDRYYSYNADSNHIFAAFLQQYNIDLLSENLHWWQFQALLCSLNEDCLFSKIVGWRSCEVLPDMPDKQRSFLYRMKRLYALPKNNSSSRLEDVLLNGGQYDGISIPANN